MVEKQKFYQKRMNVVQKKMCLFSMALPLLLPLLSSFMFRVPMCVYPENHKQNEQTHRETKRSAREFICVAIVRTVKRKTQCVRWFLPFVTNSMKLHKIRRPKANKSRSTFTKGLSSFFSHIFYLATVIIPGSWFL